MADRRVDATGRNEEGDITSVCLAGASWSPRAKYLVIADIESGAHTYHVIWTDKRTEIHVVQGATGKYLRTDRDATPKNNLDDLPTC